MKTKLILVTLIVCLAQAVHSQPLVNTSWRGPRDLQQAIMNAIVGETGDSMKMNFGPNAAFSIVFYYSDTTVLNGIWWQEGDSSFAWVDTSSVLDVLCPGIDTSIYSYNIKPGDTLTISYMSSGSNGCVVKNTLFAGSRWSRPGTIPPDTTTSLQEHNVSDAGIKVYPNPATDMLTIQIEDTQPNTTYEYALFDMYGRNYEKWNGRITTGTSKTIDIGSLAPGLYLYRVRSGCSCYYHKIEKR
jgi:hypothetical protein